MYGADIAERNKSRGKYGINLAIKATKESYENRGKQCLRQFLFRTNLNLQAQSNFNHVNELRYRVASMFKTVIESLHSRAVVMEQVFDEEIPFLSKFYQKRRKGVPMKKNNRINQRLNNIKPNIKQRVLCLYMNRMKFAYTVKILKWFLLNRSDSYDDLSEIQ